MTRVSSRVNGTIENIHVKEGISIKKGFARNDENGANPGTY